jgi:uncharacterized membrane protein
VLGLTPCVTLHVATPRRPNPSVRAPLRRTDYLTGTAIDDGGYVVAMGDESERLAHHAAELAHDAADHVAHEVAHGIDVLRRGEPYWPAQLAVAAALILDVSLPEKLTLGPSWLLPGVEGLLLVGLTLTTPRRHAHETPARRRIAIGLIALVSATNLASLLLLCHFLLQGGKANGHALILSGMVIWLTNVLIFALWYWELDRGGPGRRLHPSEQRTPDFLFVQMTEPGVSPPGWKPLFIDYVYLSFTNATAFSPTDTLPLTAPAKSLMLVQALASLVTIGLVLARAVNILA